MSSSSWDKRGRFAALLLISLLAWTGLSAFAPLGAEAQILVIAPHPDDDILTSAGVIYRARQAGTVVWVLYMTNGDYAPTGTAWGLTREGEAVSAQALLGVPEANMVFLGYPDGSLQVLYSAFYNVAYQPVVHGYQGDLATLQNMSNTTYASRGMGAVSYHQFAFGSPGANTGANVQADLVHFLNARRPTDIYVTGRCDRHPDHTTTYEFLMSALVTLRATVPAYDPVVHQTVVWAGFNAPPDADDWPLAPNPATYFTEPVRVATCLANNSLVWAQRESLEVPAPLQVASFDTNLKSRAIELHATQGGFNPITVRGPNDGHISAFVHRDEFFYPFRASASRPPIEPGTRPPAGVDAGTPPIDAGTPPVDAGNDAGTPPIDASTTPDAGRDAGSSPADSGSPDAGSTQLDAGTQPADAGALADTGALADAETMLDALVVDAAPTPTATVADANSTDDAELPPDLPKGGGTSAWPGEELEQDIDDVVDGDVDDVKRKKDSGCSLALSSAEGNSSWAGVPTVGLVLALAWRRRRSTSPR
jgi:MYXO-CTERM domain-containing protein